MNDLPSLRPSFRPSFRPALRPALLVAFMLTLGALYMGFTLRQPHANAAPAALEGSTLTASAEAAQIDTQALDFPPIYNYQGFLRAPDGTPLNDSVDMFVNLYTTPTGGTAVWTDVFIDVPVRDGYFNVEIGASTPFNAVFDAAPLYIGFIIDGATEITPREELISVPWAIYADSADNAIDTAVAGFATLADTATSAANATTALNLDGATRTKWVADSSNSQDYTEVEITPFKNNPDGVMCWVTSIELTQDLANTDCFVNYSTFKIVAAGFNKCTAHCLEYGQ